MLHTLRHHLRKGQRTFLVLLLLSFFFSSQVSLTIYVDSSFLSQAIGHTNLIGVSSLWKNADDLVGVIYTVAFLFTILAMMMIPSILRKIGNYRTTLATVTLQMLMLLGLGITNSPWLIVPMFICTTIFTSILYFNFDIFLERYSRDEDTGKIRGIFMAISSIAWLFPPVVAGYIVKDSGYQLVYIIGALITFPMIILTMRFLNHFKDMHYEDVAISVAHEEVFRDKNIFNSLAANFFLNFFYSWMIIYVPIFLREIGFGPEQIGLLIGIYLTAFVIFPYPVGYIADKFLGEKELMASGFMFMAATTALFPFLFLYHAPLWLWIVVLFVGRTGASTVETMIEAYFFKQIDGKNAPLIGYFRRMRPLAYIIAPMIASVLLATRTISISELFVVLAFVMVVALLPVFRLRDTK